MSSNDDREPPADISNLQESFSKQQKKISALKELVRKSEVAHGKSTSTAQEKVKNIAQRLTHLKSKARSRQSLDAPQQVAKTDVEEQQQVSFSLSMASPTSSNFSTPNPTPLKPQQHGGSSTSLSASAGITPGSEKIQLLRQQMEQNKALMAQRASSKQHLEQMVTQLKEKFDSTQQSLEDTSELGRSMNDLSVLSNYTPVTRERHKSATDLASQQPFSLERERIKFLENRCRLMEKQLEKERQGRDTSLNESMASQASSKRIKELENKVLELEQALQEVEEQQTNESVQQFSEENARLRIELDEKNTEIMRLGQLSQTEVCFDDKNDAMQKLNNENERLRNEIDEKLRRIAELEDVNDVLETTRSDLMDKSNESAEQIQHLQTDLDISNEKLSNLTEVYRQLETKCAELEKLGSTKETIVAKDTDSQVSAEMAKQIQELQDELQQLRHENNQLKTKISESEKLEVSDATIAEKIATLEATIESQRDDLQKRLETLTKYEEELMEKTIELNVLNANFKVLEEKLQASSKNKPLFSSSSGTANDAENSALQAELQQLKQKLDDANKATIKLKLKCKQTEKQMEKLKKSSDLHAEVGKLQKDNEQLQQKIIELEDEKGQWQLTQVDEVVSTSESNPNASTELIDQINTHAETIRLLEQQKYEQSEKLESTQNELETLQQKLQVAEQQLSKQHSKEEARVKYEMSEIQLEEQLAEQNQQLKLLQQSSNVKDTEIDELTQKFNALQMDKQLVDSKLERYMSENIELLDKVEKLSKSSSSAESIEIVERLTQQERAEIDAYNQHLEHPELAHTEEHATTTASSVSELTQTEMGAELSDSLLKLREESSELMSKIELFTTERREVLEKMEHLTAENYELAQTVAELSAEKDVLEKNSLLAENAKSKLQTTLKELTMEKELLASQVAESSAQKSQLSQELSSLQQSSEIVASIDGGTTLFDKCEKSLTKLNSELEAYRKANDKNAKFNVSKKLAKEAKNAYTQLSELLQKVKEASSAVETVTVVETVVAVTAPNGKALAEYEQLTAQNRTLKAMVDQLRAELQEAQDTTVPPSTVKITEVLPAITQDTAAEESRVKLEEALAQINQYEEQCINLQSIVEDLRMQLQLARTADDEKSDQISRQQNELSELRGMSENFDRLINDKEMSYEKQIEHLTRLRRELEGKCETYEGEMEILQTLVTEQKQQLIEAYKESEHEMNLKLIELQERDADITKLRSEIRELKSTSVAVGEKLSDDLQMECEKLRESLKINKTLVAEQVNELANKQETIDTLNQQLIDLYKTMEENANKVIEKEDEITYIQELMESNTAELENLRKDNKGQKSVVDKLLYELHSHQENTQHLPKLQQLNKELEQTNKELEQRNKDQLEKLKKFAANLKKRTVQCQEFEAKIKKMESAALDTLKLNETSGSADQLQELNTNNILLNERINELECKLRQTKTGSNEIQDALQGKTFELLERMETSAKMEDELKLAKDSLVEKIHEIEQLKQAIEALKDPVSDWGEVNADTVTSDLENKSAIIAELQQSLNRTQEELAISQKELLELRHERTSAENVTKDLANSTAVIAELQQNLNHAQQELSMQNKKVLELRNELKISQEQASDWGDITSEIVTTDTVTELTDKIAIITELQQNLQSAQEELRLNKQEILDLRNELKTTQEQVSDWGDTTLDAPSNDILLQELADKTNSLEKVESALNEVQAELLELHEKEKERQQLEQELHYTLHERDQRIQELQTELSKSADSQNKIQMLQQAQHTQEQHLQQVSEELKAKALKFEKSKAVIKERNNQIHRLQAQLKDLQDKLSGQPEEEEFIPAPVVQSKVDASLPPPVAKEDHDALQLAYEKLSEKYSAEKSTFQQTIARLETLHDGIQAKLQEDMSYIETLEQENGKFKDKICRLEECVACFEDRRASMERRANLLDAQLQSRTDEYEKSEDELIYRLNMLSEHDDVIAQRLLSSQDEKQELQESLDKLQADYNSLNAKYTKLEKDYQAYQDNNNSNLETENLTLREQLTAADLEMQRLRALTDAKLAAKTSEIDELECELSDQLEKMNADKRAVSEDLERARDECTELKDELVRLKETFNALEQSKLELERESTWLRMQNENSQQDQYDLQELRMQTMQDKTEIENLRHQIETLSSNYDVELQALRTQISELDTLRMQVGQNQTDDQVFIETENKRLTDLLAEKELIIENYQRQNLQLQMAATAAAQPQQSQHDPFALAFGLPPHNTQSATAMTIPSNADAVGRLERDLAEKTELSVRLQRDLHTLQTEFNSLIEGNNEMQRQLLEKNREIENLWHSRSPAMNTQLVTDVIPAPPMFFASEQMTPSPFDEIIQVRTIDTALQGAQTSRNAVNSTLVEQPTIEDLQRNVSDLEKHAQDLENKLATRNQREAEYEARLLEAENRVRDREQLLQRAQIEYQSMEQQNAMHQQTQTETAKNAEQLSCRLAEVELMLKQRDLQLNELKSTLEVSKAVEETKLSNETTQMNDQIRLAELDQQLNQRDAKIHELELQLQILSSVTDDRTNHTNLENLERKCQELSERLQQRDNELTQLKRKQDEESMLKNTVADLESQIIPDAFVQAAPTLDMFFGGATAPEFDNFIIPQVSNEPVVEEMIVPKRTYVCQPKEVVSEPTQTINIAGLDLGNDDWGETWGSSEAAAEAEHFAKSTASNTRQSLVSHEQQLEIQLQEQSELVKQLQLELERCDQQKQELQVKSGKLMKKLKEYKTKNEELQLSANANVFRKSASVESNTLFDDLDAAIQEELKAQVKKLESKVDEQQKIQEQHTNEKDKLLKRIDVLEAGNERMSEMKERQDMDVQMYQARIRELQEKLNKLDDWGVDGADQEAVLVKESGAQSNASPPHSSEVSTSTQHLEQRISELTAELLDISGDRQELQALLEDEKSNVARAEETVKALQLQLNVFANSDTAEKSQYNELKLEYQNLQEMYNNLQDANAKLMTELNQLQEQVIKLNAEYSSAESSLQDMRTKNQELQESLSNNEHETSKMNSEILMLRTRNEEFAQANQELLAVTPLNTSNNDLELKLLSISQDNEQLTMQKALLDQQINDLKTENFTLKSSRSNPSENIPDELTAELQEKESEIMHLRQRIEDLMREDQTEKLVLEILTKNQEIHMLKMQVKRLEDDKNELEHNLSLQITKEMNAEKQDDQQTQTAKDMQQLEAQLREMQEEKQQMEEELKVLNNHVLNSLDMEDKMKAALLEMEAKNIEINELRKSLDNVKASNTAGSVNAAPQVDFVALNAQWEAIVEQKCGEIAQMWRQHLEQREQDFKLTETRLQEEITALQTANTQQTSAHQQHVGISAETTATSTPASESTSASGSSSAAASKDGTPARVQTRIINDETNEAEADVIIERMQAALESQEMEIVTLKEQLAIRSAEYARLAAQYDPFKLQTTLSHSGMSTTVSSPTGPSSLDTSHSNRRHASTGDSSVVPKSELDLALYMLHQRDMRCEEMTVELVSLLEERDTLQLKLSNTLRQVEAIRAQSSTADQSLTQADADVPLSLDSPVKSAVAGTTASDSADELSHKLSQLQTVKHSKDKVIQEERDQRNRQMERIQQDVAKMPPAALSELVGADFSQTNHSPSTVLLNWLWGNKPNPSGGTPPN